MEAVGGSFLISLILFIIVAFFHNERINSKKRLLVILEYNEKGLKRLDNTWKEFSDIGEEFIDRNHKFSSDLDIFGKNSLFQWINLTKTTFGRKKLASKMIMNSLPTRYEIEEEQEAIKELAKDEFLTSHAWNKLFKREFFNDIKFPYGRTYEDVFIMHKIFSQAKKILIISDFKYYYYMHNDSIIHTPKAKNLSIKFFVIFLNSLLSIIFSSFNFLKNKKEA